MRTQHVSSLVDASTTICALQVCDIGRIRICTGCSGGGGGWARSLSLLGTVLEPGGCLAGGSARQRTNSTRQEFNRLVPRSNVQAAL